MALVLFDCFLLGIPIIVIGSCILFSQLVTVLSLPLFLFPLFCFIVNLWLLQDSLALDSPILSFLVVLGLIVVLSLLVVLVHVSVDWPLLEVMIIVIELKL